MRHHPLFYCLAFIVAAAPLNALESILSGEWIDFASSATKAEIKAADLKNGLFLRGLYIDQRSSAKENRAIGGAELNAANNASVYFGAGPLRSTGLAYLLAGPFTKSLHTGARFRPVSFSLDSYASATKPFSAALSLGSPQNRQAWFRGATLVESGNRGMGIVGFGVGSDGPVSATIEALQSQATLPARTSDTWFSPDPPLPERPHKLTAVSLTLNVFDSQWFFAGALSDTQAQGRGGYVKAIGDISIGTLRLLAGADTADPQFIDTQGQPTGRKTRGIVHLRRTGTDGAALLLRAESIFVDNATSPTKASIDGSYRFSVDDGQHFFHLKEFSAELLRSCEQAAEPTHQISTSARTGCGNAITTAKATIRLNETLQPEECVISTKIDFTVRKLNFSISAQAVVDAQGKPEWGASIGMAATMDGGLIMARFGTDESLSWDRITGTAPSASPLGPWTFSLSWRFRERIKARFFGID